MVARSSLIAALLGLTLLPSAGCHLFYPFDLPASEVDRPDLGPLDVLQQGDGHAIDAASDTPTPSPDQSSPADVAPPPPDQAHTPDLAPPPLDLTLWPLDITPQLDAGCNDPPLVKTAAACNLQGTACTGSSPLDSDCDGMLDAVDPAKSGCNVLRFADDFIAPPGPRWTPASSYTWTCGELLPTKGVAINLAPAESNTLGSLPLVNVAFRTPGVLPGYSQSYKIKVHLQAGSESSTCVLSKGVGTNQHQLSIKANNISSGGPGSTYLDPGWLHVMQVDYSSSLLRCWLHHRKTNSYSLVSSLKLPSKPVTSLQLTFTGIDVALEYVHAFKHPP